MKTSGYMLFMAEAPVAGLPEHPSYAPDGEASPSDSAGFAEAYGIHPTLEEAEQEAREDHDIRLAEVETGHLTDADDMDVVLPVMVHDDGSIEIFANGFESDSTNRYTAKQVYDVFGMTPPETIDPNP